MQHRSDVCGRFLVITSISGSVFICSSYPTQGLAILGHTGKTQLVIVYECVQLNQIKIYFQSKMK